MVGSRGTRKEQLGSHLVKKRVPRKVIVELVMVLKRNKETPGISTTTTEEKNLMQHYFLLLV